MTWYFLGIGSNDEPEQNCQLMIAAIREEFDEVSLSRVVRTEAHGLDAPDYLNAVACFESDRKPDELNIWCKSVEKQLGRVRGTALCRADLDILLAVEEPADIALSAIDEVYFRPLVQELLVSVG